MRKVIGIDPGKHTGVAVCYGGKITGLVETDFWGCVDTLNENKDALVIIEKPHSKSVWHNQATSNKAIQRTGVNVGSALREAELLIDYMLREKIDHHVMHPRGKVDAKKFKMITGWQGRTNQHTRDAGLLAFGILA
jgi:hypothetical protein